ncbi:protein-disulfide isomerase [Rubidibacter lacunae KORDI 51-2]|uniref:Protein-disulfide isomerase n=1 Tax=Rubidibacter lacunae KORDI 51-2 TaxID=582515 RepID=U5DTE8_9CHRO|nr:DsbA family protein [Rubidibacter lacunae]ERN42955.1 protein-disulfide isomerase [Rubidibacter lacunae KORDI 51-2]
MHRLLQHVRISILTLTAIACLIGALCWVSPAIAAAAGSGPQLERQVLEVIRAHPEAIVEALQAFQVRERQKIDRVRQAFLQQLQTEPAAIIGASPATDAIDSRLVVVEFSDFQCPFCARLHDTLDEFLAQHGDDVTLVYKHYPLASLHPQAIAAARAAWAAQQQGRFWPYHDALFARAGNLDADAFTAIARDLGLDLERFERDRASGEAGVAIERDVELGNELGVRGTPFLAIGSEIFEGAVSTDELETALAAARG